MGEVLNISDLIAVKQTSDILSHNQIEYFINQVSSNNIHDAQIGAMLMAIFLQGMTSDETASLTSCMTKSGDVLSWPDEWKHLVVDKHSTGGVGDKISLILAPALAACGLKVPMISGRSLGHTGGTLDKLESIPGYNINISSLEMKAILESVGCCIVGQSESLVPADKRLYALRDITNTVSSNSLIVSSIISKKAAEGLTCLVLDVKYGKGAFCKTPNDAEILGRLLSSTSKLVGIKATAFVTDMNEPLGNLVGNSLEVLESIECLQGNGPEDIKDLVVNQGAELLRLNGRVESFEEGKKKIQEVLSNGKALDKFKSMVIAQGVSEENSTKLCQNPKEVLPISDNKTTLTVSKTGIVTCIDAMACALVSSALGAGRSKPGDEVTHDTGLELFVKTGESIESGQPWITVYHREEKLPDGLKKLLEEAIKITKGNVGVVHASKIHSKIQSNSSRPIMVCQ